MVKVGEVEVPGPEIFWMSEWDNWFTLSINVVVVQGDGVVALVNTGAPDDLSPINDVWTQALGDTRDVQAIGGPDDRGATRRDRRSSPPT